MWASFVLRRWLFGHELGKSSKTRASWCKPVGERGAHHKSSDRPAAARRTLASSSAQGVPRFRPSPPSNTFDSCDAQDRRAVCPAVLGLVHAAQLRKCRRRDAAGRRELLVTRLAHRRGRRRLRHGQPGPVPRGRWYVHHKDRPRVALTDGQHRSHCRAPDTPRPIPERCEED